MDPQISLFCHSAVTLPGFDKTGVSFDQVVGDVPARQVQHCVPRGLDPSGRRPPPCSGGTDGHHGELLAGAALAGRRRVPLVPLGALQDVVDGGRDVGTLPL